jgi:biotin synthesis protein BioG
MQQIFLQQQHSKNLVLIFLGYGQDKNPFNSLNTVTRDDIAIVYDYQDLSFDESLYQEYEKITLIAWSMGVMIAPIVLSNTAQLVKKIALNGTVQGIDDTLGIPPSLWQATIDSLTEQTYLKFVRRMCSDTSLYEEYLQNKPQRALESFKSELISLQAIAKQRKQNNFEYDLAIVGNKDKIIAPKRQLLSWSNSHVLVKQTEIAHYSLETFKALVAHEY